MKLRLVCMRLKDMARVHLRQDNSRLCAQCGQPVGIYPSGQEVLRNLPETEIVCHVCAGDPTGILAPGARDEPGQSMDRQ